jgi:(2Fe-2S) ferredoxin
MPKFEKHIFVCTNQRPVGNPRGSCDPSGNGELHQAFKVAIARRGLKGKVRANKAGCLDQCEHGPNVVVYPEAIWYGSVSVNDVDEIVDSHILGNRPVERLLLADSCLNTETCPHRHKSEPSQ